MYSLFNSQDLQIGANQFPGKRDRNKFIHLFMQHFKGLYIPEGKEGTEP